MTLTTFSGSQGLKVKVTGPRDADDIFRFTGLKVKVTGPHDTDDIFRVTG